MRSMQWQLGILGTISAFAYRHRETKKNLCRGGRSQDLPNTDFQPAVRHLKYKQQYTHSTTNTHKMITIHTRQLTSIHTRQLKIQHVQKVNNTKVRKYCIQLLVFFPAHIVGVKVRENPLGRPRCRREEDIMMDVLEIERCREMD